MLNVDRLSTEELKKICEQRSLAVNRAMKRRDIIQLVLESESSLKIEEKTRVILTPEEEVDLNDPLAVVEHNIEEPKPKEIDYHEMKIGVLRELAKSKGVKNTTKMNKQDLIDCLSEFENLEEEHHEEPKAPSSYSIFHSMNVPELKNECKKRNVSGYRKLNRHDLIAKLEEIESSLTQMKLADSSNNTKSKANTNNDKSKLNELIYAVRSEGYEVPESCTVDDLKCRLELSSEEYEAMEEQCNSMDNYQEIYRELKLSGESNVFIASKRNESDVYYVGEATNPNQRILSENGCYGMLDICASLHLTNAKNVKQLTLAFLEESKHERVVMKCDRDCEDRSHDEWITATKDEILRVIRFNTIKLNQIV